MPLTPEETLRYIRHVNLPSFGVEKQARLCQSSVLIIGAGGLGCPVGMYLAASGVGAIGVVDNDRVELSNLQRQIAYGAEDVGSSKAERLIAAMYSLNPTLKYVAHKEKLIATNSTDVLQNYDLVIDGTDNFEAKFLIADVCHILRKPLLQGSVHQYRATIILTIPGETPCYRCVFPQPPAANVLEPCSEAGVLGVAAGMTGMIMATEAVKFLSGIGSTVQGKLLLYDLLNQEIKHIRTAFDEECPLCSKNATIKQISSDSRGTCASTKLREVGSVTVRQAKELLSAGAVLVDAREPREFARSHLDSAISIPLSSIEHRLHELKSWERTVVVYCQKGVRSLHFVAKLQEAGIAGAYSIEGGIEAWLKEAS